MSNNLWRIRVVDTYWNIVGEIRQYNSASFIPRWNDPGTFSINMPATKQNLSYAQRGYGIVAYRDGKEVIAGKFNPIAKTDASDSNNASFPTIDLAGLSVLSRLKNRLIYPDPTQQANAQTAVSNYSITNRVAGYVILNLIDNCFTYVPLERQDPSIITGTNGLTHGPKVSVSYRFDNLLDIVTALAKSNGLTMTADYSSLGVGGGSITYDCKVANDLTGSAIFSRPRRNLGPYSYSIVAPTETLAIVAGQGEGASRNNRQYEAFGGRYNTSWGDSWEGYHDRRDTDLASDLDTEGAADLIAGDETYSLSAQITDTPSLTFGRDYDLGDKVRVIIEDEVIDDIVTQVEYSLDDGAVGETIVPTVGDWTTSGNLTVAKSVKDLMVRMGNIERRQ